MAWRVRLVVWCSWTTTGEPHACGNAVCMLASAPTQSLLAPPASRPRLPLLTGTTRNMQIRPAPISSTCVPDNSPSPLFSCVVMLTTPTIPSPAPAAGGPVRGDHSRKRSHRDGLGEPELPQQLADEAVLAKS